MNRDEASLERLFKAAARARRDPPGEVPFGLEWRVLGAWRAGESSQTHALPTMRLMRGALVCACAILLVALGFTFLPGRDSGANDLVVVDSVIQLTLMQ